MIDYIKVAKKKKKIKKFSHCNFELLHNQTRIERIRAHIGYTYWKVETLNHRDIEISISRNHCNCFPLINRHRSRWSFTSGKSHHKNMLHFIHLVVRVYHGSVATTI